MAIPYRMGQRTFPYCDNRWWPLLIPPVVAALLVAAAVVGYCSVVRLFGDSFDLS
jgi:putative exporter of polyketide antibiotics